METIPANIVTLAGLAALVVPVLIGLLKPFIEAIPGLSPTAPLHDSTLRLFSLALNVVAAIAIGAANGLFPGGHISGATVLLLIIQSILQTGGGETSYRVIASTAGATATKGIVALTPLVSATLAPAADGPATPLQGEKQG